MLRGLRFGLAGTRLLCLAVCLAIALSDDTQAPVPSDLEVNQNTNGRMPANNQVPTWNGQIPTSNGQVPTSNGQVPTSNGQVPTSNGQVPTSNGQVPTSSGQVPTSNGQVPTSNGQVPTSNGQVPTSNGQVPTSNGQVPTSNGQVPTSNGQVPTSNDQVPTSNDQVPTSNGQVPTSNGQVPTSNGQVPTLNGQAPTSNGQVPTSNGQVPTSSGQVPTSNGQVPTSNGQVPTSNSQVPTSNGQVPTSNGQVPTSNDQVPTSNGQVPTSNGQVPTSNGQVPTLNGQAPTSNGQAPTSNGQAPTSNGQAPTSSNQPRSSNQVKPTHGVKPTAEWKPQPPPPSPPKRRSPPRVPSFLIPSAESSDAFDGSEASFVYVLPSRARQCFHHRSAKAFQFEFRVLHGGRLDVDVYVVSPGGKIAYESRERRLGRFSVPDAPPAAGPAAPADLPVHTVCLDNRHSSWYAKVIDFSIRRPPGSRRPNATDTNDAQLDEPEEISEELAAELKSLELSWSMFLSLTWSVEENLQRSASLQRESRGDETQDRLAMEDRAARVSRWSALQLAVMLGVSVLQVLMIRSLFDEKSLLHRVWRVRGAFLIGS